MDPRSVLREARAAFDAGDFALALDKYLWFHQHALDEDPLALAGVRLTQALREWTQLGALYPPARAALETTRNAAEDALRSGTGTVREFQDVRSLNKHLSETHRTVETFEELARHQPGLAAECFRLAFPVLLEAKRFTLARAFLASPQAEVDRLAVQLAELLEQDEASDDPLSLRDHLIRLYARKLGGIISLLEATGESAEAHRLARQALGAMNPELRAAVQAHWRQ